MFRPHVMDDAFLDYDFYIYIATRSSANTRPYSLMAAQIVL